MISGVIDNVLLPYALEDITSKHPDPDGSPEGIELFVLHDIPDLSQYTVEQYYQSSTTPYASFTFPQGSSARAGQYIWITSPFDATTRFPNYFGFSADYDDLNLALLTGTETFAIRRNNQIVDVLGQIGKPDSESSWRFDQSYVKRIPGTLPSIKYKPADWIQLGVEKLNHPTCTNDANCIHSFQPRTFRPSTNAISRAKTASTIQSDLMISGVIDQVTIPIEGNAGLDAGPPEGIELYVLNDVPDLSIYTVEQYYQDKTTPFCTFRFPPGTSAKAGQYLWITSPFDFQSKFFNYFGFQPDYQDLNLALLHGTEAFAIRHNRLNQVVDVLGDIGKATSGSSWQFDKSWTKRKQGSKPSPTFDSADWTQLGVNQLDHPSCTTDATCVRAFHARKSSALAITNKNEESDEDEDSPSSED